MEIQLDREPGPAERCTLTITYTESEITVLDRDRYQHWRAAMRHLDAVFAPNEPTEVPAEQAAPTPALSDALKPPGDAVREGDLCRCWNEGQWGRVHREDCPIHCDPPGGAAGVPS